DSMILWINGEPEPAKHISVGQANATYNSIVKVRRDPAILTKQASNYYGADSYYDLKVFPAFKNQTRHVRIFMHLQGDLSSGMKKIDLGTPGTTVVLMALDSLNARLPELNAGSLRQVTVNGKSLLKAEGLSSVGTVLNLDPQYTPSLTDGVFGILDTTKSDTSYLGLYVDIQKALSGGRYASGKRLTIVWVPSSTDTTPFYYYNYSYYGYRGYYGSYAYSIPFSRGANEKKALTEYIKTLAPTDAFNIVYAGQALRMLEPHMVPAAERFRNKAVRFLDSLTLPVARDTCRRTFEALKSAFGSIASADTPAVVFCMDLEPAPWSSSYNSTDYAAKVNAIVTINVNKATFYAYIHSSKYAFYQQLAWALNGKICNWNEGQDFPQLVNEAFVPVITSMELRFTPDVLTDGITYKPYYSSNGYFSSGTYYKDMSCYGKINGKNLSVEVSALLDGVRMNKQFNINTRGDVRTGLAMDKKWAVRMTDFFWTYGSSGRLINPSRGIGELAGLDRNDEAVYAKMVDISLQSHVLTSATALLALEPGMQLVDDPMMDDGSGMGGGVTTGIEEDSLENKTLKTALTASPNPFNPATRITLTHAGLRGSVTLSIYGVDGRLVRSINAVVNSGRAVFEWNGCDASGRKLASGIYFGRVMTLGKAAEVRLFLMK
ncbi:MAG: FlgD immunoglobulin-like domain containing protein, partial [Fibrobacterota bacterium]